MRACPWIYREVMIVMSQWHTLPYPWVAWVNMAWPLALYVGVQWGVGRAARRR